MSYPSIRTIAPRTYLLFFAVAFTAVALLLGTSQSFSAGALKVLSPNGGQSFKVGQSVKIKWAKGCLLYTSPSPRDLSTSRMPSSA